ncbi:MAG: transketolase [Clostridia bacterium]|nr:transketolase [Clostridia bacterium]
MLKILSRKCRKEILEMIMGAGSGHIGGAMSSIDIYLAVLNEMRDNDRLVVSHGHTSAALYAALGNFGYFDVEDATKNFRRNAPYEGHPSLAVNGVEWCSGSLGQGLSVGAGFALSKKLQQEAGRVFVVMGDGEQQKGQLQEAREFAVKYHLTNLIAIVDDNNQQACGTVDATTDQKLSDKYQMSGWDVVTVDGHNFDELAKALQTDMKKPLCILAKTVMGKGIAEIENDWHFHGTVISKELAETAMARFAVTEEELAKLKDIQKTTQKQYDIPVIPVTAGRTYQGTSDIRSAMGNALYDIAKENPSVPIAAFDCDLEGSVKLSDFKKLRPDAFIECGIAEHNAATAAAAVAKSGMVSVHADFAMFNIAETYSQNRMADINKAPLKLFSTHAGLDVGEDGKTHQAIDYISLLGNLHGFQVIVPADANQADGAVRYAMSVPYPVAVIGGRSKLPILTDAEGNPLTFTYGKGQWLRTGKQATVITYGNMAHRAVQASDELKQEGIEVGILNCATPCDLDADAILEAAKTGLVITYEDHNVKTGISGEVARILCGTSCNLKTLGVHKYGSSTSPDNLYQEQGIDVESLKNIVKLNLK